MANKKVSNERRKELEQIDPFQQSLLDAVAWAKKYRTQLSLAAGAIVIIAVVVSGIMISFQRSETNAALLLNKAVMHYSKARADDPKKAYAAVENDFKTIFSDYSNTKAGHRAELKFARICYDASLFDKSRKFYEKAFETFKSDPLMKNLILAALGRVCIAEKDMKKAAEYFLEIDSGNTPLLKDEAEFNLAVMYEKEGKIEKSRKLYEKIVMNHTDSMYLPIADVRKDEVIK